MRFHLLAHKLSALACAGKPTSCPISVIDTNADGVYKLRSALTSGMPTDVWVGDVAGDHDNAAAFFWTDLNTEDQSELFSADWSSLNEKLQDVTITDVDSDGLLTRADLVGLDAIQDNAAGVVIVSDWHHDPIEVRVLPAETN